VIIEAGDESLFGLLYQNAAARARQDLKIYDCWGNVFRNIYGKGFNIITDKAKWLSIRKEVEKKTTGESTGGVYYLMFSKSDFVLDSGTEKVGLLERVSGVGAAAGGTFNTREFYNLSDIRSAGKLDYQEKEILGVYLLLLGSGEFKAGVKHSAEMYFENVSRSAGAVPWIMNDIGLEYYGTKDLDRAEKYFKKILPAYPDYSTAWYNLGLVYRDWGKYDEALLCFRSAVKYGFGDLSALKESADLFWKKGFKDNAAMIYSRALAGSTEFANGYLIEGGVFSKSGRWRDAVDAWQKAALIKPDYSLVYYDLGVASLELKEYGAARKHFERYIALEPAGRLSAAVRAKLKEIPEK